MTTEAIPVKSSNAWDNIVHCKVESPVACYYCRRGTRTVIHDPINNKLGALCLTCYFEVAVIIDIGPFELSRLTPRASLPLCVNEQS